MENTFARTFLTDLLGKTLFKKDYFRKQDYSFNKYFIREHKLYLNEKTSDNHQLSLEIGGAILDFDQSQYASFREYIIENKSILKDVIITHTETRKISKKRLLEIIDLLLERCYKLDCVEGILIIFVQEIVWNLDAITVSDLENGFLPKDEFESLIEFYL